MAKKITKPEVAEVAAEVVPAKVDRKVRPDKLTVTLVDGSSRTYSAANSGKVWEALAKNFAEANEGSVIE